ncbi:hypothetical protein ACWCXX_40845, partial [Streptomyces sp. NPDC001732]
SPRSTPPWNEWSARAWPAPTSRPSFSGTVPRPRVFSHPKSESYDTLHKRFHAQNPWFKYTRLNSETHVPGVELPREVAADIEGFLQTK